MGTCFVMYFFLFTLSGCPSQKPVIKDAGPKEPVLTGEEVYNRALTLHRDGKSANKVQYKAVASLYMKALTLKPSLFNAHFNLGSLYEEQGKFEKAARHFGRALNINKNHGPTMYRLAQVRVKQKRFESAYDIFNRLLAANPKLKNNTSMLSNLSTLQRENGNYEGALTSARKILVLDTTSVVAYRLIAQVYLKQAKYAGVHIVYRLSKKLKKDDPYLNNIRGMAYLKQKKEPEALVYFQKATSRLPTMFEAQMNLGLLSLKYNDYKRALVALSQAAKLKPKHKKALLALAIAQRTNDKLKSSEKTYMKLHKLDKNDPKVMLNLGILYVKFMRQPKKGQTWLRKYIGEKTDIPSTHLAHKLLKQAENQIKMNAARKAAMDAEKKKKPKAPPKKR